MQLGAAAARAPAGAAGRLAGGQGSFPRLWRRLERPRFMPQLCFCKSSLFTSMVLAVVLNLLRTSRCSASKEQTQDCPEEFLSVCSWKVTANLCCGSGRQMDLSSAYHNQEPLVDHWSWPVDKAQWDSLNDDAFLPEMAVRGRRQWEAQAAQVQGNGEPGSCGQQQRHLQYFAQILQQE